MAIRRGTIYRFISPAAPGAVGYLVLTNDQWNDADTQDLNGALVYEQAGAGRIAIPATGAFAGPLFATPKDTLRNAIGNLSALQLRPVEDFVRDVLAIPGLTGTPPRAPAAVPGPVNYPNWSQIYYAGPPAGVPPQTKRRVVVSRDDYNRVVGGAICVRTTTSSNRGGQGFPVLSDRSKAVCVLATFLPNATIRFDPRQGRPMPSQFFTQDMAMIAVGLAEALDL